MKRIRLNLHFFKKWWKNIKEQHLKKINQIENEYIENEDKFDSSRDFHKNVEFSYVYAMSAYSIYCKEKTKHINRYRGIFFWIITFVFIVFVILSIIFLTIAIFKNTIETMVPAIVTFLANILIFPVIIAKYLFNHNEDKEFLNLYKDFFAQTTKRESEKFKQTTNYDNRKLDYVENYDNSNKKISASVNNNTKNFDEYINELEIIQKYLDNDDENT